MIALLLPFSFQAGSSQPQRLVPQVGVRLAGVVWTMGTSDLLVLLCMERSQKQTSPFPSK